MKRFVNILLAECLQKLLPQCVNISVNSVFWWHGDKLHWLHNHASRLAIMMHLHAPASSTHCIGINHFGLLCYFLVLHSWIFITRYQSTLGLYAALNMLKNGVTWKFLNCAITFWIYTDVNLHIAIHQAKSISCYISLTIENLIASLESWLLNCSCRIARGSIKT